MSEPTPMPRSPFARPLAALGPSEAGAGITVMARDGLALATVIGRKGKADDLAERVEALFGIALPAGPRRIAAGRIAFVGAGPGQWLAVADSSADPNALAIRLARDLAGFASVAEQSDSRAVIRLSGPCVRLVLAKGLPIDLHPRAFGPGDAALSAIAQIGVHLWQLDEAPTYEIAAPLSMAGSFADWLIAAGAEYGIARTGSHCEGST